MRYAVVIEWASRNYSAYVPDLPGCIATGATIEETEREIAEAIRFHVEGLREDGLQVPKARSRAEYVEAWVAKQKLLLLPVLYPQQEEAVAEIERRRAPVGARLKDPSTSNRSSACCQIGRGSKPLNVLQVASLLGLERQRQFP
jgi:predicted RNase H-like HicB family nuclease